MITTELQDMKTLFVTLLGMLAIGHAAAQDIATFKQHLASPVQVDSTTVVRSTVRVAEQGDAADIVNVKSSATRIEGFRIVVFMRNAQTARQDGIAAQQNCSTLFPAERNYLLYENPYFKVMLGNCTSQEEAIILLGRVRNTFPKSFIMRESIPIAEFRAPQPQPQSAEPTATE